jgi:hypothetical protein
VPTLMPPPCGLPDTLNPSIQSLPTDFRGSAPIPARWLCHGCEGVQSQSVTNNLDTRATALYVKTDDLLKGSPQFAPWRPAVGITPRPSDPELVSALTAYDH